MMFHIQVLGHFALRTGPERPKAVPRLVARVGCILAGWPGEWVERQRLLEELWGDRPPRTAINTLQAHVSQLRKLVGKERLIGDANGYLLDVEPRQVDAELFQELVQEAARAQRQLHLARAVGLLGEALALWNGTPYADVSDPDLRARRARLEELREVALEDRLACQLEVARDQHELHSVIADARELVTLSPLRERRHVLLIRALAAANRVAEANSALESATHHIRLVTAREPGSEITELAAALRESTDNIYPLARMGSSFGEAATPRALATDAAAILLRINELLVEDNAPVVVLRAAPERHESIAACLADALHGDFPRSIETTRMNPAFNMQASTRPGELRIMTHADADAIASYMEARSDDGGAALIITSDQPPAKLAAVTLDVTDLSEPPLLKPA